MRDLWYFLFVKHNYYEMVSESDGTAIVFLMNAGWLNERTGIPNKLRFRKQLTGWQAWKQGLTPHRRKS